MFNYSSHTNTFLKSQDNLGSLIGVLGPTNTGKNLLRNRKNA